MKFAHLSDCHIGGFRDPKMRDASTRAFAKAIDKCLEERVDFILIAGDLFDTSLPPIDRLKEVVVKLKEVKDKGIPVYLVPGSHDFSPTGKTMLDVLESAGLFVNVVKGRENNGSIELELTADKKTGAKITGMLGKKGMLDKEYYERLSRKRLESEDGFKIFMFHNLLTEFTEGKFDKIREMTLPVSMLPKNFDYYAGGHPHFVRHKTLEDYGTIAYPGPIFPNNMEEIETLGHGGFYIVETDAENTPKLNWIPVKVYDTVCLELDCMGKTPDGITDELESALEKKQVKGAIITMRCSGELASGKVSEIDFKRVFGTLYARGAHFVMKNTRAVTTAEFEEIRLETDSIDGLEQKAIEEHLAQLKLEGYDAEALTQNLMKVLGNEKDEGETTATFEERIKGDVRRVLSK